MKLLSTLTIAALLSAGSAFAASTPTVTAGATATPAGAPVKHESAMHCQKQARDRKLTGDAEKQFLKECRHNAQSN
jgi:hypothetical protein